jgi:hypothetical protein
VIFLVSRWETTRMCDDCLGVHDVIGLRRDARQVGRDPGESDRQYKDGKPYRG